MTFSENYENSLRWAMLEGEHLKIGLDREIKMRCLRYMDARQN